IVDNEEAPVVRFRVPQELLESRDVNPSPGVYTISFSDHWFKKFPNLAAAQRASAATVEANRRSSGILSLNKWVLAQFEGESYYPDDWIFDSLDLFSSMPSFSPRT